MPQQPNISTKGLLEYYFEKAITDGASDIHIESTAQDVMIRHRVDGVLTVAGREPLHERDAMISRVKVLANLDISENRLPQDGRFQITIDGKELDLRVSTVPSTHGENAVIRLLDHSKILLPFDQLGFTQEQTSMINTMTQKPFGIMLVTGPTGSGKTTTLFSLLNSLNSIEKCVVTLEDPIEYKLPYIRQTQVNPDIGLTFAKGLRAFFRQNPDIIMVGEIRDKETADIAIQAGMTGHLVLSTFHTNDALGALVRLMNMEIERFLIASAMIGVIAQRLVRKICPNCKTSYKPKDALMRELELPVGTEFIKGAGCDACLNTGFQGRIGVFEILPIDDELESLLLTGSNLEHIKSHLASKRFKTLRQVGIEQALAGVTTLEEVLRVTMKK